MARGSEMNGQNSELDRAKRPSEARIEKMVNGQSNGQKPVDMNGDKGLYGETLRPSEREDSYSDGDDHHRSPKNRTQ